MEIKLEPRTPDYSITLMDGLGTALVASANFRRPDGAFSGLGLDLQVSPLFGCDKPDEADAEMFFRAVALVKAAPKLLAALEDMVEVFAGEYGGADLECIKAAREAIADATTHPLHDQLAAAERAHEESQELARQRAAERADRYADDDMDLVDPDPYLYGDEDTGEDCNVNAQEAADAARESASEDRLLGGAA